MFERITGIVTGSARFVPLHRESRFVVCSAPGVVYSLTEVLLGAIPISCRERVRK
jgi:hypothetical protein